jgi:hypothetical protein
MSARIPTIHGVHDSNFTLSGGLEVLTSIFFIFAIHLYTRALLKVRVQS